MAYLLLGLMDDVPKDNRAFVVVLCGDSSGRNWVMLADEPTIERRRHLLDQQNEQLQPQMRY